MISASVVIPEGATLEQVVDGEIETFQRFFIEKLKNSNLTLGERAILKTYMHWQLVDKAQG